MEPDDLNSFRPISNLTFLSKIVERVVTKQFTSHAALNGLCPERQSAYRQFHSTESAVLVLHNDIVCAIDRGEITGLVRLDLSSAFDNVDHTSLLSILESRFSVTGQSLAWFRSYLTDRAQVFTTLSTVQSDFPDITNIRYPPGLRPWSNNLYQLYREYYSNFFHARRPISSVC